jgi:hypothetical protein
MRVIKAGSLALAIGFISLSGEARADFVVSLTQATTCQTPNGNGGDWCLNTTTPFNLSSFTTQNLTTTGSSAFFDIFNNTGSTQTSLQITFTGTLFQGGACGGGGTGIQGSGPKPTSGNATCTVSITPTGASFQWNNINWGSGQSFDFQIASFSNGDTGTFCSVPGPVVGGGLPGLVQPADVIAWSLWRRAHQAAAQKSHLKQKSQL